MGKKTFHFIRMCWTGGGKENPIDTANVSQKKPNPENHPHLQNVYFSNLISHYLEVPWKNGLCPPIAWEDQTADFKQSSFKSRFSEKT